MLAAPLLLTLAAVTNPVPAAVDPSREPSKVDEPRADTAADPGEPVAQLRDPTSGGRTAGIEPAVPDDATLEASGAVIGEILIRNGDIFDTERPEENNWLFRTANKLHRTTRPRVIRRLLLFKPGDRYSRRVLEESERLLRATSHLYDAQIDPVRYEDNEVVLEVRTRDVWTLRLGVGFSRAGGANEASLGVRDSNFLGTGKAVTLKRTNDVDRTSNLVQYFDPNIAGSRLRLRLDYSDNSDGRLQAFGLDRPFFSLDSHWAAGLGALDDTRVDSLWDRGEIFDEFRHREDVYQASFGLSRGRVARATRRWTAGFTYERDRFERLPGAPSIILPEDRTLSYPWIALHWLRDAFVEVRDLDRLQRTEDLNLGQELRGRFGWSFPAFGADCDCGIFDISYGIGTSPSAGQILLGAAYGSGRVDHGRGKNVLVGASLRYYVRDLGRHVFFLAARADAAHDLDRENQLLLGGDTGLRGYPIRYLWGDRRFLLTLEQRFYTGWHVFRLFHVGAAVFFDAGNAWFRELDENGESLYKDVGFGLRLGSSRSSSASMVHVDLAFPLDGGSSIKSTQLLITTKETF